MTEVRMLTAEFMSTRRHQAPEPPLPRCQECGSEELETKTLCGRCLEKSRAVRNAQESYRDRKRKRGECIESGCRNMAEPRRRRCTDCLQQAAAAAKERRRMQLIAKQEIEQLQQQLDTREQTCQNLRERIHILEDALNNSASRYYELLAENAQLKLLVRDGEYLELMQAYEVPEWAPLPNTTNQQPAHQEDQRDTHEALQGS